MAKDADEARIAADDLLKELIRHQPNLFLAVQPGANVGMHYAKCIAALREGLIEMYKTQP